MFVHNSRRRTLLSTFAGSCLVSLAASATAIAGTPGAEDLTTPTEDQDPAIFGGEMADVCAWPTVVSVGGCTGTLIHPEIVLYAAHCGGGNKTMRFGNTSQGSFSVGTQYCRTYPEYNTVDEEHIDWAFCRLDYAVDIPVAPVVMGCEWADLKAQDDVAVVGYGQTYNGGGGGTKQWAITKLIGVSLPGNVAEVGGQGGAGSCPGDSGGPAFKRYPDGSWHQFGIVSTGTANSCDENTQHFYSLVRNAIPWVEEESGIDVTPCTDANGIWDPGPDCTGFFSSEPGAAFGNWNNGCVGGPISGPSSTCGPASGEPQDTTAPVITITSPEQGASFPNPSEVTMDVSVEDASGIQGVKLEIDGVDIGAWSNVEPYGFTLNFADDAVYSIQANAEDWSGNMAYSNTVEIAVGNVDPPDPTTTTGGEEETGGGETTDGGEAGTDSGTGSDATTGTGTGSSTAGLDEEGGDASGCSCSNQRERGPGGLVWTGMLLFAGARLRRRSTQSRR
jgi:hypothetical protein